MGNGVEFGDRLGAGATLKLEGDTIGPREATTMADASCGWGGGATAITVSTNGVTMGAATSGLGVATANFRNSRLSNLRVTVAGI